MNRTLFMSSLVLNPKLLIFPCGAAISTVSRVMQHIQLAGRLVAYKQFKGGEDH